MEGEEREGNLGHTGRELLWRKDVFYSKMGGKSKFDINMGSSSRLLVHGEKVRHDGRESKWLLTLMVNVGNLSIFWGEISSLEAFEILVKNMGFRG